MRYDCSIPDIFEGRRANQLLRVQHSLLGHLPLVIPSLLLARGIIDDFEHFGSEPLSEVAEVGLSKLPLGVELDVQVVHRLAARDIVMCGRVILGIHTEVGIEARLFLCPLLFCPHRINIMPSR